MVSFTLRLYWEDLLQRPWGCRLPPCQAWADLLLDGEPYCLDCAELIIERLRIPREARRGLPGLYDRTLA